MARKERRPGQGRRSPGGERERRAVAADERARRHEPGSTRRGPLGARSKGAGRRREVRSPPFPSRSTDSASLAGSEPPPVALARLVSGEMSRLGERRVEEDAWATWLRGPPSKDGERSRKSARIVAALGRQRATIRVPCSCGECVPVAYATPARENAGRSEEAALGDKPSAYRAREGRIDVRRRRAALASGDCPGSHRGPGRGERRNRSVWKSRNDRRYV